MEAVNGVSDGGGPPPPSPLTGCYLLIVIGEPHSQEHKNIILQRISKGLLSWDVTDCLIDLEKELAIITEQAPEGEEARYGERLIQYASENLVTEVLIHPAVSTLAQCVRNLLSSFTRHRHIIHAGYTFAANGSWILQDGTFSYTDFAEAFHEIEVQRVIRAYENSISVDLHCSPEGDWTRLPKEPFTKSCKVRVNPVDVLTSGSPSITNFLNYISPFLIPTDVESLLECSDVVGNIRFSHPTLYIFPGGQGDAALFGINGFNMLLDGGFSRKACFWDFVRHLDRLDAVLMTRLNNGNACGISAVLRRKMQNAVYPQIGHFFCNIQERKSILSPDGDKDKDPLLINLLDEGQEIITNLKKLNLTPQVCYKDTEPINLYHKVGHGTLDMYVLSPAKDSKEVKDFLHRWNTNDQKLFANQKNNNNSKELQFPLQNLVSICALLIWQPANPNDNITRILYPGSTPQQRIFEGLDKLRNLEYIKYPVCSESKLVTSSSIMALKSKQLKDASLEKLIQPESKKLEKLKEKPPKSGEIKNKIENKLADNIEKLEMTNGVSSENETDKTVKKSDSTDSDKSMKSTKPRKSDDKIEEKKPKHETKTKEVRAKPRVDSKPEKKKALHEKKASPTTPKKTIEAKTNGEKERPISKPMKYSPSTTPAKSAKEASNRKVIESKNRMITKKEIKTSTEKKDTKPERKPISRRTKAPSPTTKTISSPVKKISEVQKPDIIKKAKLDKEGTTDSSTVSTPSADQKDITKLTQEEIEQLKAQELADLKEEQEVVKEIEAVFRKGEIEKGADTELRKIKDISLEDKSEPEEYLIIEKEEVEHDSLDEKEKEDETQKHARDSEESEKMRKHSDDIKVSLKEKELGKYEAEDLKDKEDKEKPTTETSKEVSATSPEDKIDTSIEKKVVDIDNNDQNVALESQPDEKYSATAESGATTAPTLPEDERITLDEIKEDNGDQAIEEKHVKEDTKEKDVPVIQLPAKTFEAIPKLPPVVGIRLDKQSHIRDIVKTPDEVADLPVHEEADIEQYHMDVMKSSMKGEEIKVETKTQGKIEADIKERITKDTSEKDAKKEVGETKETAETLKPKESVLNDKEAVEEEGKALVDTSLPNSKIPLTESEKAVTKLEETQEIKSKDSEISDTAKDLPLKETDDKVEEEAREDSLSKFMTADQEREAREASKDIAQKVVDVELDKSHAVKESKQDEIPRAEIKEKDKSKEEKQGKDSKEQELDDKIDKIHDAKQVLLEKDVENETLDEHTDKVDEVSPATFKKETIEVTETKTEAEFKETPKEAEKAQKIEKEDTPKTDIEEIKLDVKDTKEKQSENEKIEDIRTYASDLRKEAVKELSEEKKDKEDLDEKPDEKSALKIATEPVVEEIRKEEKQSENEKIEDIKTYASDLRKEDVKELSEEKKEKEDLDEKPDEKSALKIATEPVVEEIRKEREQVESSTDPKKYDTITILTEDKDISIENVDQRENIETKSTLLEGQLPEVPSDKIDLEASEDKRKTDIETEIKEYLCEKEEKTDVTLKEDEEQIALEPKDKEQGAIQSISIDEKRVSIALGKEVEQEELKKPLEDEPPAPTKEQILLEKDAKISAPAKDEEVLDPTVEAESSIKITESLKDYQEDLDKSDIDKLKKDIKHDEIIIETISEDKTRKSSLEKDKDSIILDDTKQIIIDNEAKMSAMDEIQVQESTDINDVTFYIGDEKLERSKTEQKQDKMETKEEKKSKLDEKDVDDKQKQDTELEEVLPEVVENVPHETEGKSEEKKADEQAKGEKLQVSTHAETEAPVYMKTAADQIQAEEKEKKMAEREHMDTSAGVSSQDTVFDSNKYTNGIQDNIETIRATDVGQKIFAEDEKGTKEIAEQKLEKELVKDEFQQSSTKDKKDIEEDKAEKDKYLLNGESVKEIKDEKTSIGEKFDVGAEETICQKEVLVDKVDSSKDGDTELEPKKGDRKESIALAEPTTSDFKTDSNKTDVHEKSTEKATEKDKLSLKETQVEDAKSGSQTESPETSSEQALQTYKENDILDKTELGRKSPKEREQDVAVIVASVAEVLKSDAPLEEFEGKIPLTIAPFVPFTATYTTELRETHITTVDSPVSELPKGIESKSDIPALQETTVIEEKPETYKTESKLSGLLRDSKELMEATSKMISDIKSSKADEPKSDSDTCTVQRMLVTASSEDGGEEIEICPKGTITFPRSSESSGRSSPDLTAKKLKPDDDSKKSSGKSTPEIKVVSEQEKADIESTEKESLSSKSSGKSTPKSGKESPDIREQSPTSDSGIIEVTKPDIKSGKSTPDLKDIASKSTLDTKDSGIVSEKRSTDSERSTPDISAKPDTLRQPESKLAFDSGRSSPDSKCIDEINRDEKLEEKILTADATASELEKKDTEHDGKQSDSKYEEGKTEEIEPVGEISETIITPASETIDVKISEEKSKIEQTVLQTETPKDVLHLEDKITEKFEEVTDILEKSKEDKAQVPLSEKPTATLDDESKRRISSPHEEFDEHKNGHTKDQTFENIKESTVHDKPKEIELELKEDEDARLDEIPPAYEDLEQSKLEISEAKVDKIDIKTSEKEVYTLKDEEDNIVKKEIDIKSSLVEDIKVDHVIEEVKAGKDEMESLAKEIEKATEDAEATHIEQPKEHDVVLGKTSLEEIDKSKEVFLDDKPPKELESKILKDDTQQIKLAKEQEQKEEIDNLDKRVQRTETEELKDSNADKKSVEPEKARAISELKTKQDQSEVVESQNIDVLKETKDRTSIEMLNGEEAIDSEEDIEADSTIAPEQVHKEKDDEGSKIDSDYELQKGKEGIKDVVKELESHKDSVDSKLQTGTTQVDTVQEITDSKHILEKLDSDEVKQDQKSIDQLKAKLEESNKKDESSHEVEDVEKKLLDKDSGDNDKTTLSESQWKVEVEEIGSKPKSDQLVQDIKAILEAEDIGTELEKLDSDEVKLDQKSIDQLKSQGKVEVEKIESEPKSDQLVQDIKAILAEEDIGIVPKGKPPKEDVDLKSDLSDVESPPKSQQDIKVDEKITDLSIDEITLLEQAEKIDLSSESKHESDKDAQKSESEKLSQKETIESQLKDQVPKGDEVKIEEDKPGSKTEIMQDQAVEEKAKNVQDLGQKADKGEIYTGSQEIIKSDTAIESLLKDQIPKSDSYVKKVEDKPATTGIMQDEDVKEKAKDVENLQQAHIDLDQKAPTAELETEKQEPLNTIASQVHKQDESKTKDIDKSSKVDAQSLDTSKDDKQTESKLKDVLDTKPTDTDREVDIRPRDEPTEQSLEDKTKCVDESLKIDVCGLQKEIDGKTELLPDSKDITEMDKSSRAAEITLLKKESSEKDEIRSSESLDAKAEILLGKDEAVKESKQLETKPEHLVQTTKVDIVKDSDKVSEDKKDVSPKKESIEDDISKPKLPLDKEDIKGAVTSITVDKEHSSTLEKDMDSESPQGKGVSEEELSKEGPADVKKDRESAPDMLNEQKLEIKVDLQSDSKETMKCTPTDKEQDHETTKESETSCYDAKESSDGTSSIQEKSLGIEDDKVSKQLSEDKEIILRTEDHKSLVGSKEQTGEALETSCDISKTPVEVTDIKTQESSKLADVTKSGIMSESKESVTFESTGEKGSEIKELGIEDDKVSKQLSEDKEIILKAEDHKSLVGSKEQTGEALETSCDISKKAVEVTDIKTQESSKLAEVTKSGIMSESKESVPFESAEEKGSEMKELEQTHTIEPKKKETINKEADDTNEVISALKESEQSITKDEQEKPKHKVDIEEKEVSKLETAKICETSESKESMQSSTAAKDEHLVMDISKTDSSKTTEMLQGKEDKAGEDVDDTLVSSDSFKESTDLKRDDKTQEGRECVKTEASSKTEDLKESTATHISEDSFGITKHGKEDSKILVQGKEYTDACQESEKSATTFDSLHDSIAKIETDKDGIKIEDKALDLAQSDVLELKTKIETHAKDDITTKALADDIAIHSKDEKVELSLQKGSTEVEACIKKGLDSLVADSKMKDEQVDSSKTSVIVDDKKAEDDKIDEQEKSEEKTTLIKTETSVTEKTVKDSVTSKELDIEKDNVEKNIKDAVRVFIEAEKDISVIKETDKDNLSSIASSSKDLSKPEETGFSGKSTPDIADVERDKQLQETLSYEKHIPGCSTPPTVPVSPIVKDMHADIKSDICLEKKIEVPTISTTREQDVRSCTPGSDDYEHGISSTHSDISSSQMSKAPNMLESEEAKESDEDDILGSPTSVTSQIGHSPSSQYDFDDEKRLSKTDQMSVSFYGTLPGEMEDSGFRSGRFLDESDLDFEKAMQEHRQTRGEDLSGEPSYLYEITTAKYVSSNKQETEKKTDIMTSSFIGTELPETSTAEKEKEKDPIETWGKPLGLPSPAPPDNKGTPKKEKKLPANVTAKNKLNDDRKRSESPSKYDKKQRKAGGPIYVDLTYVPHHGNSNYSYVDFFKRIRARYYVFSGIEPSKEVYNALLEAKQSWEDKELEVTIIPTYDTDVLGYWVAENEELLTKCKIDLSPSASRCTINLQDHETSCSAYRLEF